jgi:hypothetical protein
MATASLVKAHLPVAAMLRREAARRQRAAGVPLNQAEVAQRRGDLRGLGTLFGSRRAFLLPCCYQTIPYQEDLRG